MTNLVMRISFFMLLCFSSYANSSSWHTLGLHGLFSDHAVLQRGVEVPVWGTAAAGAAVNVIFAGQNQFTVADNNGQWMVKLDPLVANSTGETLTVTSLGQTETRVDILVGEVWLASGQSNMALAMFVADPFNPPSSIPAFGQGSLTPTIRLMQMNVGGKSYQLSANLSKQEKWKLSDLGGLFYFSSVGYYFGRELHQVLDVPIGIISSTAGGTPIRQWMPDSAIQPGDCDQSGSSIQYNYSISPLLPYAIKGVIWYQGEANARGGVVDCYFDDLSTLIESWRSEWANAANSSKYNFPFYVIQLPNYQADDPAAWIKIREQVLKVSLQTENTEMVVTIDVGNADDVHPRLKLPVAERLARIARALDYGEDIVYSGPVYKSIEVNGNTAILSFNHIGSGLASSDGQALKYFEIAGSDGVYYFARASISGNTVEVNSNIVTAPVKVRYAWSANPENPNFSNQEGLIATPFRTDAEFWNDGRGSINPLHISNVLTNSGSPNGMPIANNDMVIPVQLEPVQDIEDSSLNEVNSFVSLSSNLDGCEKGIVLNGSNDWINIPDFTLADDFTIEGWVKLAPDIDSKDALFGQEGSGPDINFYKGKVRLYTNKDQVVAKSVLLPDTWQHIAISRSGTDLTLYVNGLQDATGTWGGVLSLKAIGRGNRGFLKGMLDEIRVWNLARTATQINTYFNTDVNFNVPGLVGYWSFNEKGQTVNDVSWVENQGLIGKKTIIGIDNRQRVGSTVLVTEKCNRDQTGKIPNKAPIANNDTVELSSLAGKIIIKVLDNDIDSDGALDKNSLTIVNRAAHGNVVVNNITGEMIYTHDGTSAIRDIFVYTVADAQGLISNQTTVERLILKHS